MERDNGGTSKRERGEAGQEDHTKAKRLKVKGVSLDMDAFSCGTCTKPLKPPIFQCSKGHFLQCLSCHKKQPKCQVCTGDHQSRLERSYVMERAVNSILIDCCYAEHGCPERNTYYFKEFHEKMCPRAPAICLYAGCGFDGRVDELLDHLAAHHRCPRTEFQYWKAFDLRVDEPGVHVLRSKNDGQHILLHAQQVERPRGYAISVVCVPRCWKPTGIGCSMSFSCLGYSTTSSVLDILGSSMVVNCVQSDFMFSVPKGLGQVGGNVDDGVVLRINFTCADLDDDDSDSTYNETDEEEEDDSDSNYIMIDD